MKEITEQDLSYFTEHQKIVNEIDSKIEFGEALHAALSRGLIPVHQGQRLYRIYHHVGTTAAYSLDLIEWYRGLHD